MFKSPEEKTSAVINEMSAFRTTLELGTFHYEVKAHIKKHSSYRIFIELANTPVGNDGYRQEVHIEKLTVSGDINLSIDLDVRYLYGIVTITHSNGTSEKARSVLLFEGGNTAPVISGAEDKIISLNSSFDPKEGVTAWDAEDGELTAYLQITGQVNTAIEGTNILNYGVRDNEGLVTTTNRVITVKKEELPNNPPVIAGVVDREIDKNTDFNEMAGIIAYDVEDGEITDQVICMHNVNTSIMGSYGVIYTVTDSAGAAAVEKCTISVI